MKQTLGESCDSGSYLSFLYPGCGQSKMLCDVTHKCSFHRSRNLDLRVRRNNLIWSPSAGASWQFSTWTLKLPIQKNNSPHNFGTNPQTEVFPSTESYGVSAPISFWLVSSFQGGFRGCWGYLGSFLSEPHSTSKQSSKASPISSLPDPRTEFPFFLPK